MLEILLMSLQTDYPACETKKIKVIHLVENKSLINGFIRTLTNNI